MCLVLYFPSAVTECTRIDITFILQIHFTLPPESIRMNLSLLLFTCCLPNRRTYIWLCVQLKVKRNLFKSNSLWGLQTHLPASLAVGHKYLRGMSLEVNICPDGCALLTKHRRAPRPGRGTLLWPLFNLLVQHKPASVCSRRMHLPASLECHLVWGLWGFLDAEWLCNSKKTKQIPNSVADVQYAHTVLPV